MGAGRSSPLPLTVVSEAIESNVSHTVLQSLEVSEPGMCDVQCACLRHGDGGGEQRPVWFVLPLNYHSLVPGSQPKP